MQTTKNVNRLKSVLEKPRKLMYGVTMLKHVMKKGGKEGGELKLEDLDENLLRKRYCIVFSLKDWNYWKKNWNNINPNVFDCNA